MKEKIRNKQFTDSSWVELFFSSNIHIMGFSLDFAETDIWWVINRRARMMKDPDLKGRINNRICFYCHEINEQKKALLKSFNVEVEIIALEGSERYEKHYSTICLYINESCKR